MIILSWNVNGLRAAERHGFSSWLATASPDICCLQEIKATIDQLPETLRAIPGYHTAFSSAQKRGYSGVATLSQQQPLSVKTAFDNVLDPEGRILITEHPGFTLFNIYFPNGKKNAERLAYKMAFYDHFLTYVDAWRATKDRHVVIGGDFNTAHHEIDLARPGPNSTISGFLPQEREWISTFIDHGYVDTFRHFHKEPGQYTFWDQKTRARERNVGWRVDYFFVDAGLLPKVRDAFIMPEVMGSDHCPIGLELSL